MKKKQLHWWFLQKTYHLKITKRDDGDDDDDDNHVDDNDDLKLIC